MIVSGLRLLSKVVQVIFFYFLFPSINPRGFLCFFGEVGFFHTKLHFYSFFFFAYERVRFVFFM